MPLESESDQSWRRFLLKKYNHRAEAVAAKFSWAAACERAVNTLVEAVLQSNNSKVQRFSCRLMILQTSLSLTESSQALISNGMARLKCLELHVDHMDLAEVRAQLSGLCKEVLRLGCNLEGLHIGFRDIDHVSIPIESVFNGVKMERLKYVGVQ